VTTEYIGEKTKDGRKDTVKDTMKDLPGYHNSPPCFYLCTLTILMEASVVMIVGRWREERSHSSLVWQIGIRLGINYRLSFFTKLV